MAEGDIKKLGQLRNQRAIIQGSLTRTKNYVEKNAATLCSEDLETRLQFIEENFKQALNIQSNIELMDKDEPQEKRELLEDLYFATKSKLLAVLAQLKKGNLNSSVLDVSQSATQQFRSSMNLPKLQLPKFSGKYTQWIDFYSVFNTLIHEDNSLTDIEKFQHLRSCLSESAYQCIQSLEITSVNYLEAITILKNRFNNTRLILKAHIRDIFNVTAVLKNSADSLRQFIDSINSHLRSVKSICTEQEFLDALLSHIIFTKLDSHTLSIWEERSDVRKIPTWEMISSVLENRFIAMENLSSNKSFHSASPSSTSSTPSQSKQKSSFSTTISNNKQQQQCVICEKTGHCIYKCTRFLAMSPQSRFIEAKQRSLCINCLNKNHTSSKCTAGKCRICHSTHNTLLHIDKQAESPESSETTMSTTSTSAVAISMCTNSSSLHHTSLPTNNLKQIKKVFLATAVVLIKTNNGKYIPCRALLDSASQLNFITERLCQQLRIKRSKVNISISGISDISSQSKYEITSTIKSRINNFSTELDMLVLHKITESQPNWFTNISDWNIPSNIQLADPLFYQPHEIDMLIGADTFFNLLSVGQIKLNAEQPILHKTVFGWIVAGNLFQGNQTSKTCLQVNNTIINNSINNDFLDKSLQRFWEIENHEPLLPNWSDSEKLCEKYFVDTVSRQDNGRIIVRLPLKEDRSVLGNSYETAKRRFLSLERRLQNNPELKKLYCEFMNEYITLNHMEQTSTDIVIKNHNYYLPHHCVIKPDSTSTKLRVVFDGSCKTTSGKSVNSIMHIGPTIQPDLFTILIRFRLKVYAFTADIQKMYRQVNIHQEDTNLQCILWRNDPKHQIQTYRLKTITYGTAAAPFLAIRSLHYLSDLYKEKYPLGSYVIQNQFYVDDMLSGANTVEEARKTMMEVDKILKSAKFTLCKWASNHSELLSNIPEGQQEKLINIKEHHVIKTLGLAWEPKSDSFHYHYNNKSSHTSKVTKRQVLSEIASLFDPMGLINPIIVLAKIFMQRLWQLKVHWDESLPIQYKTEWENFRIQLKQININVPRPIIVSNFTTVEIHGFADASLRAYGCCLYLRCIDSVGRISINLLAAKSRVSPVKSITIPKLELCGAHLLATFLAKVLSSIELKINNIFCWTDSEIVLDWLSTHPSNWSIFVSNRVARIQEIVPREHWSHVGTNVNPADLVSRGTFPSQLVKSKLWFNGPSFLEYSQDNWPKYTKTTSLSNAPERRKASIMVAQTEEQDLVMQIKFNSFKKIQHTFAYIQRFITNTRNKKNQRRTSPFTPTELEDALLLIVRIIQQSSFSSELTKLKNDKHVHLHSHLKSLSPFIDNNNIIRVGGRLQNSALDFDAKHQIVLPKRHKFVTSLITHYHNKFCHAGPLALSNILRQQFWILNAKSTIKSVVHTCIPCFRHRPILFKQIMGNLPKNRVTPARPFINSGVDFCGPVYIHYKIRGKRPYKAYIAVFICFATKATHLEIVHDLTTDAFIGALKRFIARRGFCKQLSCDNGTNFVGARRELSELRKLFLSRAHNEHVQTFCAEDNINFSHIPPRSPHFGGLWEAAVKSAKHLLYRSTLNTSLTYEQLLTIVTQIEAILNSRPMTALSSDPCDFNALTPGHFLIGTPLTALIEPSLKDKNMSQLSQWRLVTACQQHFWTRWSQEYLNQLQQRHKWVVNKSNIKLNTLVLVSEESCPPQKWLLGRIIELHHGSDKKTRVATVKTPHGVLKRAIAKLAPLPFEEDN